ncbi:MAG: polysaccharide deacetylase family protein [Sedimentisphaerales bacterium]|nr:polysaccharide deacetylase family protein [Sedimentisphaerales bacterium]
MWLRISILFLVVFLVYCIQSKASEQVISDRVVVLTFDDALASHATFVAPLLKQYGFGATFFICEFPPDFATDKTKYMTWQQIRLLHDMGFEIANHTRTHTHVNRMRRPQLIEELEYIENRCREYSISQPASFAYPAYDTHPMALEVLREKGYRFARIGGSRPYEPSKDDPLLIPSFSTTGTDKNRVLTAIQQAAPGRIVVLTIHGVPDMAHPHVNTPPELFREYVQFLHDNQYTVIAMRDLEKYLPPKKQDTKTLILKGKKADKPLFRDPVYDGAADPVLCWNTKEKKWFMFYTNRRANVPDTPGVTWVHGTPIGIAESSDGGATWTYRGTAEIDYGQGEYSYWAPEVIEHEGTYHMYLTFVPGIFKDWSHPRSIIHLTSKDLMKWTYQSTLKLSSDRSIDACVLRLSDGTWRMWYNNEPDRKSIYYADSPDLYTWTDRGKAIGERPGEGPKVFHWKNRYWMVVDVWNGLGVYHSEDCLKWTRQKTNLLEKPGTGSGDQVKGGHPDVVISEDRAYLFYFTHPGRTGVPSDDPYHERRSLIQVVEIEYKDGELTCERDKPTYIQLLPPNEK